MRNGGSDDETFAAIQFLYDYDTTVLASGTWSREFSRACQRHEVL
jgi:hypothetical protein